MMMSTPVPPTPVQQQTEPMNRLDDPAASGSDTDRVLVREFGRYQLQRILGRGGYGVVYEAFDPVLNRSVALKMPQPQRLFSPETRERFLREARMAGQLDHPNIVPIYEVNEIGPVCYIASALCLGPDLTRWMLQQPHPVSAIVGASLILTVARGLNHAHSRGIIHCDLKPSNILLQPMSDSGRYPQDHLTTGSWVQLTLDGEVGAVLPRIADFGLAQLIHPANDLPVVPTPFQAGTPQYSAPECLRADTLAAHPGMDIFSLGVMLVELTTGKRPFANTDELLRGTPPQIEAAATTAPLPADFIRICERCLAFRADQRYPTVTELMTDLECFLTGNPLPRQRNARLQRGLRTIRRIARPTLGGILIGSLMMLGIVHGIRKLAPDPPPEPTEQTKADASAQSEATRLSEYRQLASQTRLANEFVRSGRWQPAREMLSGLQESVGPLAVQSLSWRWLWNDLHAFRQTLTAEGSLYTASYHPNEPILACAGSAGIVWLWRIPQGEILHILPTVGSEINELSFTPDGKRLIAITDHSTIVVWNVPQFTAPVTIPCRLGKLFSLVIAPDSRSVTIMDNHGIRQTWDLEQQRLISETVHPFAKRPWIRHDRQGEWEITVRSDAIRFERIVGVAREREVQLNEYVSTVAIDPAGEQAIIATLSGGLYRLQLNDSTPLELLTRGLSRICSLCYSPDGRYLLSGHDDSRITYWNARSMERIRELLGHQRRIWHLRFRPDGHEWISLSDDGTVQQWPYLETLGVLESPIPQPAGTPVVGAFAFTPDSQRLLSWNRDNQLQLWDCASRELIGTSSKEGAPPLIRLGMLPNRSTAISIHADGSLRSWKLPVHRPLLGPATLISQPCGQLPPSPEMPNDPPKTLLVVSSNCLLVGSESGRCRVLTQRGNSWEVDAEFPVLMDLSQSTIDAPNGRVWVTTRDGKLESWSVNPPRLEESIPISESPVRLCRVNPKHQSLAWSSDQLPGTLHLGRLREWNRSLPIKAHRGPIRQIAFSADGQECLSVGSDQRLYIWQTESGQLLRWHCEYRGVESIAVAPNGGMVAVQHHPFNFPQIPSMISLFPTHHPAQQLRSGHSAP
ncbi:WD40 repeat domain-containing serine/threonine-protein kinase [Tuwongella immobilis]|uniref:Protein kinase domain-containing protein n=1 Tax=Tuwongella immobilis TaxID=692036 RepID=A0A6C2YJV9_9BACT|nr:serine/threonine-protein kinase [Tuwongella immobilis]VIP01395.1 wd40 repeat-containing protein : WD40 repeat-containing protein OS=Singulisphaera acidiphila (strain ATCC BAA-1392 / DSM 18658 / VKM B-2454 / MOB10) GN=Sinac_6489 PE=4 SV=1: Pkinase: WD40: WD40: WD40 [Tuwongella immobilis]VTR98278.1 wd40 repeat-containing protein : WD40 repeat-containing protein OS=Singulisphaera acidiphila (strain ATCC BAA-1392 / DSM 18658 / VKM B-2454 / MOB10) GN=Sinac_6489 PE=4 SV=1: Pkinase: WD40: WD40: WD40 